MVVPARVQIGVLGFLGTLALNPSLHAAVVYGVLHPRIWGDPGHQARAWGWTWDVGQGLKYGGCHP